MNFFEEKITNKIYIKSYNNKKLTVRDNINIKELEFNNSIIMDNDKVLNQSWDIKKFENLKENNLEEILNSNAKIVLLGTGDSQKLPSSELLISFYKKQKSLDCMTNKAACRTFNILVSEGREVILGLIQD